MLLMLQEACGFALQIIPCMLLCLLPFRDRQYVYSKRVCLIVLSSILTAASIGFALLMNPLYQQELRQEAELVANIYMSAILLLFVGCYFFLIRDDVRKKLLILCIVVAYAIILYLCVNFTVILFPQWNQAIEKYRPVVLISYAVFTAVTLPFAWMAMRYMVRNYLQELKPKAVRRSLGVVLILTGFYYLFVFTIGPSYHVAEAAQSYDSFYFSHIAAFLFCTASLLVAFWFLFWEIRNMESRLAYKNQLQIQQMQYEKIQQDIENARRARHDMHHHMHTLEGLLSAGKVREAGDYLQKLEDQSGYAEPKRLCKDPVLNALLQYYAGEAEKAGISFACAVSVGSCLIDPADMTILLGNCLENALRACREAMGERVIQLKISRVNSTLVLLLENSCAAVKFAQPEKPIDGYQSAQAFSSSREDGGMGLTSIELTAKKYGGLAQFKYDFPYFYTRISLEIPQSLNKRP